MSEKKQQESNEMVATYTRIESFYIKNTRLINIAVSAIVLIIAVIILMKTWYVPKQNEKAQLAIWKAEEYFKFDQFQTALDGDSLYPGFLQIIGKGNYRFTKTKRLAHYYAGICYLNLHDYDNAIKHLKKYKGSDTYVSAMAIGCQGDAYAEKGDYKTAINKYEKAASKNPNDFTSPMYLMRAGILYERLNKNDDAADTYTKIKEDFPNSEFAKDIDKYIVRAETKIVE